MEAGVKAINEAQGESDDPCQGKPREFFIFEFNSLTGQS
jgi:hypothetical protein